MDKLMDPSEYKFRFETIYASELHLGVAPSGEYEGVVGGPENARLSWDWRFPSQERNRIEVFVGMHVMPTSARREEIRVAMIGRFEVVSSTVEGIGIFANQNAVALILPYVRQAISDLGSKSFFGPVVMPLLNVKASMSRMKPDLATGARQLAGEIGHEEAPSIQVGTPKRKLVGKGRGRAAHAKK